MKTVPNVYNRRNLISQETVEWKKETEDDSKQPKKMEKDLCKFKTKFGETRLT